MKLANEIPAHMLAPCGINFGVFIILFLHAHQKPRCALPVEISNQSDNNFMRLRSVGVTQYLLEQREKWLCADYGGVISMHQLMCSERGKEIA